MMASNSTVLRKLPVSFSRRRFRCDATWPPKAKALAALFDLGLSITMVADYFDVPVWEVAALSNHYGLATEPIGERGDASAIGGDLSRRRRKFQFFGV